MNIEALMTRAPKTCQTTDTLHRAAQIMWDEDCGCVPVVEESGRLVGWLTDRDVCMASYTKGRPLHEIGVGDVMSRTLFTLGPRDGVEAALVLFTDRLVRRAPVVDDAGAIVGVVSISDLVEAGVEGTHPKHLSKDRVLGVVHAVSRPGHARSTKAKAAAQATKARESSERETIVPAGSSKKKSNGPTRAQEKSKRG